VSPPTPKEPENNSKTATNLVPEMSLGSQKLTRDLSVQESGIGQEPIPDALKIRGFSRRGGHTSADSI